MVLITTLLLLTLLAGYALAAQRIALSQAQQLNRISELTDERQMLQSASGLALPLIGEMLLQAEVRPQTNLIYSDRAFIISLEQSQDRYRYNISMKP